MRASLILGSVLSFAMAGSAMAETVLKGVSSDEMREIIVSLGHKAEVQKTDEQPWIVVTTDKGLVFNVFLYDCGPAPVEASQKCGQMQFRVLWDNTKKVSVSAVNRFHLEKVFGRGYVLEDGSKIGLEYPMHLEGGVTKKNLIANLKYFLRTEVDFESIVAP